MQIKWICTAAVVCEASIAAQNETARLAKWKSIQMPLRADGLSARERQMVEKLVAATRLLDQIYWRQSDVEGHKLYLSTKDATLRSLLGVMGGRWDLADDNR